jgi:hypothetical protein
MLYKLAELKKPNTTCSYSLVETRSKMMDDYDNDNNNGT